MDSSKHLSRTYRLGILASLFLCVTLALGVFLGSGTRARFVEIAESWSSYAENAEKKGVWISALRGHLGYGGIIHNFKNYVLRGDDAYRQGAERQLAQFDRVMTLYLAEDLPVRERQSLETIQATIAEYRAMLPIAEEGVRLEESARVIDRQVRIDDTAAIAALDRLETIWRDNRRQSTGRIISAVAEGEALVSLGFFVLFFFVLAALGLGFLLLLLLRDMMDTNNRLLEEFKVRHRLEVSEQRLTEAVEQSPATILITDTDAKILYANRHFEEITGWDRASIVGHTPKFLQSGDASRETYDEIRKRLRQGREWHGIFRNLRKDGSSYWADTTILPLMGQDGEVTSFLSIAEDITEKRKAREQVVRAQKVEAVALLAGGIAHDFNNVLSTIVGSVHLAALDAEPGSDLAGEIEQIDIAAGRAQALVRQLLAFARHEPGNPSATDLSSIVDEVTHLLEAAVPPTITFSLKTGEPQMWVLADPTHLHQILMNLCSNAAEALGSTAGHIRIEADYLQEEPANLPTRESGWVRLMVADNGPGMTFETQQRLFDAFYTTKPLGKGSGLGLAVVEGLVKDMGGSISVDSAPGEGARFILILPRARPGASRAAPQESPTPRGTERLLLVDDDTEFAATFRRYLTRLGYQVEAFTAPLVALERLRAEPSRPNLVICDIIMPEMDGEAFARHVRQLRPDCPIIFCTGFNPGTASFAEPPMAMIDKPVDPPQLARRIREMLDMTSAG
ncbi:hybrid sensor histidine kinase/response regulator [Notoacmeibacter ruber]|uniref:histidine kinase n=1 Tax=Notoacmeibacter ruber TaxID=2670375 RepID=A0A3L7JEC8_9HYPH|nr:PAS domain S-box protein [Notoacmeibacter ruber]RLQ89036.1 PAS domain S-box protein [Notoacmeibacter ruber]